MQYVTFVKINSNGTEIDCRTSMQAYTHKIRNFVNVMYVQMKPLSYIIMNYRHLVNICVGHVPYEPVLIQWV